MKLESGIKAFSISNTVRTASILWSPIYHGCYMFTSVVGGQMMPDDMV